MISMVLGMANAGHSHKAVHQHNAEEQRPHYRWPVHIRGYLDRKLELTGTARTRDACYEANSTSR